MKDGKYCFSVQRIQDNNYERKDNNKKMGENVKGSTILASQKN